MCTTGAQTVCLRKNGGHLFSEKPPAELTRAAHRLSRERITNAGSNSVKPRVPRSSRQVADDQFTTCSVLDCEKPRQNLHRSLALTNDPKWSYPAREHCLARIFALAHRD